METCWNLQKKKNHFYYECFRPPTYLEASLFADLPWQYDQVELANETVNFDKTIQNKFLALRKSLFNFPERYK